MLHKLFGTITKSEPQEDGTIKVYGVASTGERDVAGEIVQPDAMKAALPDYTKFPALREMHQPLAAGKVLEADVDGEGVTNIVALVVDPIAVQKVKTGVYAGFSIGGKVTKRDATDRTVITGLRLVEISLVDSPCNPDAVLTMWKADMPNPADYTPPREAVVARAKEIAKRNGAFRFSDYVFEAGQELKAEFLLDKEAAAAADELDTAADTAAVETAEAAESAAVSGDAAVDKEAVATPGPDDEEDGDGPLEPAAEPAKEAAAEGDAVTGEEATVDPATALQDALDAAKAAAAEPAPAEPENIFEGFKKTAAALNQIQLQVAEGSEGVAEVLGLNKSLYSVGRFARLLDELAGLQSSMKYEEGYEGDTSSGVPAAVAAAIQTLGGQLVDYAREEVAELISAMVDGDGVEIVYVGDDCCYAQEIVDLAKADTDLMEKAGARHSKKDKAALQSAHDALVKLGAECDTEKAARDEQITSLTTENERLAKALTDATPQVVELTTKLEAVTGEIATLKKRFEDEPLPPKTAGPAAVAPVSKSADSTGGNGGDDSAPAMTDEQFQKAWDALPEAERGQILLKIALSRPQAIARAA